MQIVKALGALVVAGALCVSAGERAAAGDEYGSIAGRVISSEDSSGLAYANVIVFGTRLGAMSDSTGRYEITHLPPGTYALKAFMMGYKAVKKRGVVVTAGQVTEVNFVLDQAFIMKIKATKVVDKPSTARIETDAVGAVPMGVGVSRSGDEMHARGGRGYEMSMSSCALEAGRVATQSLRRPSAPWNTESYDVVNENGLLDVVDNPYSTFSVDVDAASYGNGHYAYIDHLFEARKVLVDELGATLYTIAKDVKIQVEFNPARVERYRLIGYENRMLEKEDFEDDVKDAGEIGAGHSVTALYEVVPAGDARVARKDHKTKYMTVSIDPVAYESEEMLTVRCRYKPPEGGASREITRTLRGGDTAFEEASDDFRFAAAVAQCGMLLRDSGFRGESSYQDVLGAAKSAMGKDEHGYRHEFVRLVEMCRDIDGGG